MVSSTTAVLAATTLLFGVSHSLAWLCGWAGPSSAPVVDPTLATHMEQHAQSAGYSSSAGVGAFAAVSVCAALTLGRVYRRCAATSQPAHSRRVVAMEAGGRPSKCPKTGGPVCFCHCSTPQSGLSSSVAVMGTAPVRSTSAVTCHATFPGTDVAVDATGVSFPVKATVEVGEAGKSCDGSDTKTGVTGTITFTQMDAENCTIDYEVKGLAPGDHGFHVHEKADFSNGCASAGPHYNPFGKWHGGPDDEDRHVGDLGNITADADGTAKGTVTDKFIKIFGEYTVVGRSIMIHADPDDLGRGDAMGWPEVAPPPAPAQHTKTTGNAGARIACGVIVAA